MGIRLFIVGLSIFILGVARSPGADPGDTTYVRFDTNFGYIDVRLYSVEAPHTVANFLQYLGTWNNLILNRSIQGFVVQGGLTTW